MVRRLRQAIDGKLRGFGLTEATWRPLVYVGRLGEGVHQKPLAAALGIEGPSLVRLLDDLERRGLVERRADETDRRAREIHLTPAGRDLQRRAATISAEVQRRLLAEATAADLAACERVFEIVERALEEAQAAVVAP